MQLKPRKRPGLVDEIWFQNMIWGRYYRTISEPAYCIYEWHLDIKIKITCLYTLWILHLEICNILNSQEVHYKLECVWRNDYCRFPCQSSRRSFSVLLIQSQQGQGMFSVTTALLVLNWWQWTAVDALSICVSTYRWSYHSLRHMLVDNSIWPLSSIHSDYESKLWLRQRNLLIF